jgi:site-specific recombinase XerD
MNALVPQHHDGLGQLKLLVLDTVAARNSKRAYDRALQDFLDWYATQPHRGFTKAAVQGYRSTLDAKGYAPSTINVRMTAIRRLAAEAADNGLMSPELAAGIGRVKGARIVGQRTGRWLTREEAEKLIGLPDASTLKGKRDRALLGLLIGTGLRRDEAANLGMDRIQQRDGRWALIDIVGKSGHVRTVPMPGWAKSLIDTWAHAAGIQDGCVFRPLNKAGKLIGDRMTDQTVYDLLGYYTAKAGVIAAPHDLRRTFAKLCHKGGSPLEQIQLSLGHQDIATTMRYLGVKQNLEDAPCDRLGLQVNP